MSGDEIILAGSHVLHLLATVIWIGGLAIFVLWLYPEMQRKPEDENSGVHRQLLYRLQKRFRPFANLSLIILLGTGMVQMSADPNYKGFMVFENTWSIAMLLKHLAFGFMTLLAILIQFWLVPELERAQLLAYKGKTDKLAQMLEREARFTRIMGILGGAVLVFTAIATAV